MVATSFGFARSETSQMIGPSKLPWMAYVPRNARSEFIDCSNPLGGGTLACMRTAPSASAASVFPALSPTRGSDIGEGALVVVPAQARAAVRRQAAIRRAGIGAVEVIIYKEGGQLILRVSIIGRPHCKKASAHGNEGEALRRIPTTKSVLAAMYA